MVISTNLNLGYLGSWTDYYVLPDWQAVKLTFFACKCHMIIFHLNVKNVIQHYCIQEMGWGGGGGGGEKERDTGFYTLSLKSPAFHSAMDDSMT